MLAPRGQLSDLPYQRAAVGSVFGGGTSGSQTPGVSQWRGIGITACVDVSGQASCINGAQGDSAGGRSVLVGLRFAR